MNTPLGQDVTTMRDKISTRELLKINNLISPSESNLGEGKPYFPVILFLCLSNSIIFAHRFNFHQNRIYFFGSIIGSWIITSFTSRYLLGNSKIRQITNQQIHCIKSANFYEHLMKENNKQ